MVIELKGRSYLIDDEDFFKIKHIMWYFSKSSNEHEYLKNIKNRKSLYMHRFILSAKRGEYVDHINGNTLDNRKSNLRICSSSENLVNQKVRKNKIFSKHKGISYIPNGGRTKKWTAQLQFKKKHFFIGYFLTEQEAKEAYTNKAKEVFGEFYNERGAQ